MFLKYRSIKEFHRGQIFKNAVELKLTLGSGTSIFSSWPNYSSGKFAASSSVIVETGMLGIYVRFNESFVFFGMLSTQLNHIYMLQ